MMSARAAGLLSEHVADAESLQSQVLERQSHREYPKRQTNQA